MSFPASLTQRTIKGRFVTYPGGAPAVGSARFILDEFLQGPNDDTFVAPFDITIPFDANGEFSIVLPSTNDPDWTHSLYRVIVRAGGKVHREKLAVPYDSSDPIDLAEVFNVPSPTPGENYLLLATKGQPNGVASLDVNGKVPSAQLPSGNGGTVLWTDIVSKPTTFPPSTHTHVESDVTGLVSALATKADLVGGLVPVEQLPSLGGGGAVSSVNGQIGTVVLAKADIGLANVDNTADTAKPVSTAQQTALALKAPLASPTFTGTVSGVTAAMVGLGSADNTADSAKPVSTAQQAALDLKAPLASPSFTGTVSGVSASMVGLGNASNTSDAAKPISIAQQSALDLKAPLASPALTGTPSAPTATAGTSTTQLATTAFVTTADALKAPLASPTFTGTVAGITASMVGLGSVNNTADSAKPVSTAQQAALDLKAPLASPTFTGTVSGVSKSMVGLGNVDNTADTAKPVSTAQQSALDAKAPLASPALTGTPTSPTPTAGDNTTKVSTTAFVTTALAAFTARVIVLGPSDPIPGGTPAGTVVVRTAT